MSEGSSRGGECQPSVEPYRAGAGRPDAITLYELKSCLNVLGTNPTVLDGKIFDKLKLQGFVFPFIHCVYCFSS